MGHRAGRFFQGTDIFYGDGLFDLRQDAEELLEEDEGDEVIRLPEDAFVFAMHQGYEFTYFRLSEGDDPPVYQFMEGKGPPVKSWPSFSDYLIAYAELHAQLSEAMAKLRNML
jgi:hypothetical protein